MRQNIANFLYFNFLGRTSQKKHPVVLRIREDSLTTAPLLGGARRGRDQFFENEAIRGEFLARNGKRYGIRGEFSAKNGKRYEFKASFRREKGNDTIQDT